MMRFSRFVAVGVFNTVWGYSLIFAFMYILKWSPELSNVSGYAIALLTSYALNRTFTFHSANAKVPEFGRFLGVFWIAFGFNFLTLTFLVRVVEMHPGVSQVLAGVAYVVVSYVLNGKFVFK